MRPWKVSPWWSSSGTAAGRPSTRADEIEQTLQNEMEREIPSTEIGELVMDKLKDVDEVSYVRFASVYRQFKDISTFMAELNKLLQEK